MVKLPKYDKGGQGDIALLRQSRLGMRHGPAGYFGAGVGECVLCGGRPIWQCCRFRPLPRISRADSCRQEMASPANAADSLLVSNLEKDAALKTVTLRNTPWVNDAAAETMRMASLTQYTDTVRSADAVKKALSRLSDLQRADGGLGWCRGMESSEFITYGVLEYLSDLRQMDYLPRQADGMAKKAFAYCDKEFVQDWERTKKEYFSLRAMLDYLFEKSAFGAGNSAGFGVLENAAMKKIKEEWKSFSIDEKAKTAILLSRKGDDALAGFIL